MLTGCVPRILPDRITPNIYDQSVPDLWLNVYYDATHVDTVVKPIGVYYVAPNRCIYVSNPFTVEIVGRDFDGGISYVGVGSLEVVPTASTIIVVPRPVDSTQVDDPYSPNVTYPNPGMSPGSHTAEVTYYTGSSGSQYPPGVASLQVRFDFAGKNVARIIGSANNTSVYAWRSYIDGYFVRPADASHAPGSVCAPP